MATEVKRSQIEDTVDSSWSALATEEGHQGIGIGTLLFEAGAEERGGRGGSEGGGGGGAGGSREGGEPGVLNSEINGRISWQPSLIRRMS